MTVGSRMFLFIFLSGYNRFHVSNFQVVPASGSVEFNAQLMKDDPEHWASAYDFGEERNVLKPKYHSNSELYSLLSSLENAYPDAAEFHGGDDLVSMMIHWLKVTQNVSEEISKSFKMYSGCMVIG